MSNYSFLALVSTNKEHLTIRELENAELARDLHRKLGAPGYRKYFKILERDYLRNCLITVDDSKRSLHIYGPDASQIKLSMTR